MSIFFGERRQGQQQMVDVIASVQYIKAYTDGPSSHGRMTFSAKIIPWHYSLLFFPIVLANQC
jgi:hypothetical protein